MAPVGEPTVFLMHSGLPLQGAKRNGIICLVATKPKKAKQTKSAASSSRTSASSASPVRSPDYKEYEKRYALFGQDRPKLTPKEFDQFDDELLELLALESNRMTDDQIVRLQELEFLLIDTE